MNRLITWSTTLSLLVALVPACGGDDGTGTSVSDLVSTCKQMCNKEKDCLGAEASVLDCDQMCSTSNIQKKTTSDSNETCDYGKLRSKMEACLSVECSALQSCFEDATSACGSKSSPATSTDTTTGTPSSSTGSTKVGVPTSGSGSASDVGQPPSGSGSGSDVGQPPSGSGSGSDVGQPSSGSGSGSDVGQPSSGSNGTTSSTDCSVCERANACCQALLGLAGGGADASSCDPFSKAQCEKMPAAEQSQFIDACSQTLQDGAAAGIDACK
jgi:hypothetical protein